MKKTRIIFIIIIASMLSFKTLQARDFNVLLQSGFGYGGDEIVKRLDGGDELNAGDGLNYDIGAIFNTFENRDTFHTSLTVGFLFDWRLLLEQDNIYVVKVPITLTQYYTVEDWRFGAGVTYHILNKYYGNEYTYDVKYENSLGAVFSIIYLVNREKTVGFGLKITSIDYAIENVIKLNATRFAFTIETQF